MTPNHTYIIAEMACSHEGDAELARTIIRAAGTAGADAIQLQIWQLEDIMVPHHPSFEAVKKLELSQDTWRELATFSRAEFPEMELIACVNDALSIDFCESLEVDAYKLHSSDLSNPFIIERVAATGRRIDLSIGASSLTEIETGIDYVARGGGAEIWLMYGIQNFPTPPEAIRLDWMMKLAELFELPIGYQDHCDADEPAAFWLPAAAMGMGVDILEKHLTHDRSKKGCDHEAALNPDEFARFVAMVREIDLARGSAVPQPFSEDEETYRRYAKKSLVTAHDLPEGHVVAKEDLLFMRAEDLGVPPDQADLLIGKTLQRAIPARHLILTADVG